MPGNMVVIEINANDRASAKFDAVRSHAEGSGGAIGGVFQTALGVLSGNLMTSAIGGIGGLLSSVVKTGAGFDSLKQQATIAFTTMLGDGQQAKAFLDDLQDFAAKTPFEFPDLIRGSQRLLAMGIVAKDVRPTLTAIGDAVAGLGGGPGTIERVTLAIGQMNAKGKVSAEEMMQLTEAGIPAWDILARKIGVSVPEAMKLSEKGAIDSATAIAALTAGMEERFGGMMEKQSHTAQGLFSTLHDTFAQVSGQVLGPFFAMATNGMEKLVALTSTPAFAVGVTAFAGGLAAAAAKAVDFAAAIGPPILDALGAIAGFVADTWPTVRSALADFWETDVLPKVQQAAALFTGTLLPALQQVASTVSDLLLPPLRQVFGFITEHKEILTGVAVTIGGALVVAFTAWAVSAGAAAVATIAAAAPVIAIGLAIAALTAGIIWLVKNWDDVTEKVPALGVALDAVKDVAGAALEAITDQARQVVGFFQEQWPEIQAAASRVLDGLQLAVQVFVGIVKGLWDQFGADIIAIVLLQWDQIKTVISTAITIIEQTIRLIVALINGDWSQAWDAAKTIVSTAFTAVKTIIGDELKIIGTLIRGIAGVVGDVGGILVQVGRDVVGGLIAGIRAKWDDLVREFTGLLDKLPGAAKKLLHIDSPSRVFADEVGAPIVLGIIAGIEATAPALHQALDDLARAMGKAGSQLWNAYLGGVLTAASATSGGSLAPAGGGRSLTGGAPNPYLPGTPGNPISGAPQPGQAGFVGTPGEGDTGAQGVLNYMLQAFSPWDPSRGSGIIRDWMWLGGSAGAQQSAHDTIARVQAEASRAAAIQVTINVQGDVNDAEEFQEKVEEAIRKALRRGAIRPGLAGVGA